MGLVDRASADMAIAVAQAADEMWQAFENPSQAVDDLQTKLDKIVQGGPYRTQIIVEQVYTGAANARAPIYGEARTPGPLHPSATTVNYLSQVITQAQTRRR